MSVAFVYVGAIVLGALLWGVSHVLTRRPPLDTESLATPGKARRRRSLGVGLTTAGVCGLLGWWRWELAPGPLTAVAVAVGAVVGLATLALLPRRKAPTPVPERATVVRSMQPGAYGQVKLEMAGRSVLLAARNVDTVELVAGSLVSVVEGTRSVVSVRREEPSA